MNWKVIPRSSLLLGVLVLGLELVASPMALAQRSPQVSEGYTLLERGWVDDAIAAFQAALTRQPNSAEARLGLALAYQRAGRDVDAWQAYQAVIAVAPENATALAALGELGGYRPEWQRQGIEALTQLLGQNSQNLSARSQRALLYGYQGRFTEALADYDLLLAQNPSPQTLLGAAQIYAFSGDFAGSLALFERYRQTGPLPIEVLTAYALALQETGNAAAAIALLEPELRPGSHTDDLSLGLRTGLANAYDASGQTAQALELLNPLVGNAEARLPLARAYSAIARRQQNLALFEQATDLYRQALAATADPSYGLRVEVADVLSESPTTEALALEMFEQLVSENPTVSSLAVKSRLLAYRTGQITAATAAETLGDWLSSQDLDQAPPELVELVGALPADPARAPLYETLLAQQPNDLGLRWRTIELLALSDPSQAQTAMESLIAAHPDDLTVYFFQGELAQRQPDLPLAAAAYRRVLAQEPENLGALSALAGVEFQQGNLPTARALYDQVLALEPEFWQARYAIAELNIADDQKLAALEQLRQIPDGAAGPANLDQRAQDVEFELLRRRGFQPSWERY